VTVLLIVAIDGVSDFIPNLVTASVAFQVERICFFSCSPRCCCIVSSNEMARIHLHRFCFCDCPHEYSPPLPRQCNVGDRISKSSRRTCRATSSSAMLLLGYSEKSSSSRLPAQRLIHLAPKFRVRARSWSDSAAISVSADEACRARPKQPVLVHTSPSTSSSSHRIFYAGRKGWRPSNVFELRPDASARAYELKKPKQKTEPPISTDGTSDKTSISSSAICFVAGVQQSGSAASVTPLPAALPLFASGLSGIGLLAWRRTRKKTAALAA
jgi:hypothetical protein